MSIIGLLASLAFIPLMLLNKKPTPPTMVGSAVTTIASTTAGLNAVTLPAGVQAHDTIVIVYHARSSGTASCSGFTGISNGVGGGIFYKLNASGSEGTSVSMNFTVAGGTVIVFTYILRNMDNSKSPEDEYVSTTTTVPDPAAITPSWGATPTYFLVYQNSTDVTTAPTAYPTGYTDGQHSLNQATSANVTLAAAWKQASATTEDPNSFTAVGGHWKAATLAFKGL